MAKPGLDGHDRGIKILARAFRDDGMEVIYLGLRQTPDMIVSAALQENADVIALSVLSGAHMTIFKKVKDLMNDNKMDDVLLTGGGIIPQEDMDKFETWKKLKFDILFVGDDWYQDKKWEIIEEKFKSVGVKVIYFPYTKGISSTLLNETLKNLRE